MMGVSSVKRIDKSIKVINEKELEYINLKRRYEKATKDKLKLAHLLTQVNSELEDSSIMRRGLSHLSAMN